MEFVTMFLILREPLGLLSLHGIFQAALNTLRHKSA